MAKFGRNSYDSWGKESLVDKLKGFFIWQR